MLTTACLMTAEAAALTAGVTAGVHELRKPISTVADRIATAALPDFWAMSAIVLLVVTALVLAVLAVCLWRAKAPAGGSAKVVLVLVVVAAMGGISALGGFGWTSLVAGNSVDRTYAYVASPVHQASPAGPGTNARVRWTIHHDARDTTSSGLVVPGRDVVVEAFWEPDQSPVDYTVRALDLADGRERWHFRVDSVDQVSPIPLAEAPVAVDADDGRLLLVAGRRALVLDVGTGQTLGTIPLPGPVSLVATDVNGNVREPHPTVQAAGRWVVVNSGDSRDESGLRPVSIDLRALTATPVDLGDDQCWTAMLGTDELVRLGDPGP